MKKILALLSIIFILLIIFSASAQAGMKIWPAKLSIDIHRWDEQAEEITYPIQVINTKSYGMNVTARIENPSIAGIDGGYSFIPDVSWVEIKPETQYIEPGSEYRFEVIIRIPEDQKELLYNEKWDVRAVFSSDARPSGLEGVLFKVDLAVKLLISTPQETQESQYLPPIFIFFSIAGICFFLIILYSYVKKKKSQVNTVFYFKKDSKK